MVVSVSKQLLADRLELASLTTMPLAAFVALPRAVRTPVPVVVVAGAAPAPPPITRALAARAADDAHVVPLPKYGMPPDVPATVRAGVVVAVATEMMPPVNETLVTVPAEAQVPSPRQ